MLDAGFLDDYINKIKYYDPKDFLVEKYRLEYMLTNIECHKTDVNRDSREWNSLIKDEQYIKDELKVLNDVCAIANGITTDELDSALKRGRAEKPIITKVQDGWSATDIHECPGCGKLLYYRNKDKYCCNCGQKIDWSE